jgi:anthranilate phosphoribosyltransferase
MSAPRAAALMEAALALHAVGLDGDLVTATRRAAAVVDGGEALALLDRWVAASHASPKAGAGEASRS